MTHASDRIGRSSHAPKTRQGSPKPRLVRWLAWSGVVVAVLGISAGALVLTERSSFCKSCHEMTPYYSAWATGHHASNAECVQCHVDPGVVAHLAHKPTALKEVWNHFTRDNRFPNYSVVVPNSRCLGCHPSVDIKVGARFSHAVHEGYARCQDCHATTGHEVSLQALRSAGVLKAGAGSPPVPTGATPSAAPGHKKVVCQQCHDQAKMKCSACHSAPHEARGECSGCHKTGDAFAYAHPAGVDCAKCHKPPAGHYGASCAECHSPGVPFAKARFSHPGNTGEHSYRSFACVKCHPKSYQVASCTCHGGRPPQGD